MIVAPTDVKRTIDSLVQRVCSLRTRIGNLGPDLNESVAVRASLAEKLRRAETALERARLAQKTQRPAATALVIRDLAELRERRAVLVGDGNVDPVACVGRALALVGCAVVAEARRMPLADVIFLYDETRSQ